MSDFAAVVKNRKLMLWILVFVPMASATSISMPFISPALEDLYGLQKPALLLISSIISAGQVVSAAFLGWFGDRFSITWVLIASFGKTTAGMLLLAAHAVFSLLLLAVFFICARQVTVSLSGSLISKYSLVHLRGTVFGLYMFLMGIEICGPYVGGMLYESSPTQPFIWTSISLILLSFLVMIWDALIAKGGNSAT